MQKLAPLLAAAVLFTLALFAFRSEPYAAQKAQDAMRRWEYDTIEINSNDVAGGGKHELNKKGKDGWELCGTAETGFKATVLILKRPAN